MNGIEQIQTFLKKYPAFVIFGGIAIFIIAVKITAVNKDVSEEIPKMEGSNENVELSDREEIIQKIQQKRSDKENNIYREKEKYRAKAITFEDQKDDKIEILSEDITGQREEDKTPIYEAKKEKQTTVKPKSAAPIKTIKTVSKSNEIPESSVEQTQIEQVGFGIEKQGISDGNIVVSNEFISASFEQDVKIKDGSSITFRLSDDMVIDNIKFYKNSLVFASANFASKRVFITSSVIKNTDGKERAIRLECYDGNYLRGLPHNQDMNEKVNDAGDDAIDDILFVPGSGGLINAGRNVAENLKREPTLAVSSGYKVYFKNEE